MGSRFDGAGALLEHVGGLHNLIDVERRGPEDAAPTCTRGGGGSVSACLCDECRLLDAASLTRDEPLWALGMEVMYPVRNPEALGFLAKEFVRRGVVGCDDLFPSQEQVVSEAEAVFAMYREPCS